jgi:8-amino-3,8-dideoxy-alpha-D-manno-octulosonate transaminase
MPGFEIFGEEERQEVSDVLTTGVLFRYGFDAARKGHWKVRAMEHELAERAGIGFCHLCSSGTAAISIALTVCGVGAGDEVILPPFTFVASFEAVLLAGAIPVFAEIDETLCLDPADVARKITSRTKAVMPVHMCGAMARIDELKTLCDRQGLLLIEDACQSLGATFQGKWLGTFGQAGCFSFDAVKTVTCGEGGAVITNDPERYRLAHAYADHGHDHIGNDRGAENHPILGFNYRICELNAAVGLAQVRKLDKMLSIQRANKRALQEAMQKFGKITFRTLPDEKGDSATHLSFMLPDEDSARRVNRALTETGVDGCFYWYDNNWHYLRRWHHLKKMQVAAKLAVQLCAELPDYDRIALPRSDEIIGRTISLQIKLGWTPDDLALRIQRIDKVLDTTI